MTTIKVLGSVKGKFGPQLRDKEGFLSFGKFFEGDTSYPVGTELEVDLFVGKTGSRYINQAKIITLPEPLGVGAATEVPKVSEKRGYTKKADVVKSEVMTKEEWNAKDRRISRQGCIQASVHALGQQVSKENLFEEASKLAELMLEWVNK